MSRTFTVSLLFAMASLAALAQTSNHDALHKQFRVLYVNAGQIVGTIRSFQGVNGPPYPVRSGLPNLIAQYRDLHIDSVRTHDSYGPTEIDAVYTNQGLKDVFPDPSIRSQVIKASRENCIFPDWDADPDNPRSYNFGPTDKIVKAIVASGASVFYRVGRSFGANREPPKDDDKYANIVAHIAMHYDRGWDRGFYNTVNYWEIWNEPQGFWSGTAEQFYELYDKVSLALKKVDPSAQVGADGNERALNAGPYREGLFQYIKAHNLPFDFYSWHTYADKSHDPYNAVRIGQETRRVLDSEGFAGAKSILSEWNLSADFTAKEEPELGSMENASYVAAVLVYLQDSEVDLAHFYRGDALWMGLFNDNGSYRKPAYAFRAVGSLLNTPQRLLATGGDTAGFAVLAGRSKDGKEVQILIDNYEIPPRYLHPDEQLAQKKPRVSTKSGTTSHASTFKYLPKRTDIIYHDNQGYSLTVSNLPWGKRPFTLKRYRLTNTENFSLTEQESCKGSSISLSDPLSPPGLELIVLKAR